MENLDNNINTNRPGRILSGLVIVLVGLAFLLDNMGFDIPHWVFSWHTFLILIGVFVGVRRNFKGIGWLIMILIGSYYTLNDITGFDFDASKYALGIGLIILGGYLLIKPKSSLNRRNKNRQKDRVDYTHENSDIHEGKKFNSQDFIEVTAVFGGSQQLIYSKNFQGGDVSAVFGGADINLTQADFTDVAKIDVAAVFGGIKLIVPANWIIKSNVTPIFGSVEDKRGHLIQNDGTNKVLVLEGTVMFGGVEIRSF